MNRVGILSLGCPRNLVDSEIILSRLKLKGYSIVDIACADIGIVNTCSFIKEAKEESIETILDLIDLKKQGRLRKILVYGCLPQRYQEKLLPHFKEVDAFVGRLSLNHAKRSYFLSPKHYAYVKICEGCLNSCSFCIIPKIKGKFSSRRQESIIEEVVNLDKKAVREINIIGQDTTLYGKDIYRSSKLIELLKNILNNTKNIDWIRLLYLYPSHITDDLLDLISNEERICKYIDLPLQHINSRILRLMNRETTKTQILKLIDKIRKRIPGVAIRTSLIVGFPTETDKEFKELLEFIEDVQFERLGVFIYSREEDTPAYSFKPQVLERTKNERFNIIMSRQQEIAKKINERYLGRVIDVLIDEREDDYYLGRSQYDAPEVDGLVFVNPVRSNSSRVNAAPKVATSNGVKSSDSMPKSRHPEVMLRRDTAFGITPGKLIKVKITDTLEYDLVGETINEYS